MANFNFKARFVEPIELGTKRQTIRKPRGSLGRHGKVGGPINLTHGSRYAPKLIGMSEVVSIVPVTMNLAIGRFGIIVNPECHRLISSPAGLDRFAYADGFRDWADMLAFWAEEHPGVTLFQGIMTTWGDLL